MGIVASPHKKYRGARACQIDARDFHAAFGLHRTSAAGIGLVVRMAPAGRSLPDRRHRTRVAKFQRIDEHIDRAYRIALVNPIIKAFRQQRRLLAIRPLNKTLHQPPAIQQGNHSIDVVFTQSGSFATVSGRRPARPMPPKAEVSYTTATQQEMTLMTETVTIARPPVARAAVTRPRSRKSATGSASALALHLDCSRTYIGKLEAEGVIQRHGDGFPLDQNRVAYLRYLRRERQQSPRAAADAELASAKAALLRIRIEEKQRTLVRQSDVNELTDSLCGVVLTHLSSLPARCAPRGDLATRRNIERVVFEVRTEMAKVCQEMADKAGEPPLSEQG